MTDRTTQEMFLLEMLGNPLQGRSPTLGTGWPTRPSWPASAARTTSTRSPASSTWRGATRIAVLAEAMHEDEAVAFLAAPDLGERPMATRVPTFFRHRNR